MVVGLLVVGEEGAECREECSMRRRRVREKVVRVRRVSQTITANRLIPGMSVGMMCYVHVYTDKGDCVMHYHFPVFHHYRLYDPADYNHLQVSSETKELFRHITRYTPQAIELETQLRPFIPEYIPAIGDIDAFLKVGYWDHALQVCTCIYRALNEPLGSFICVIVYTVFFLSKVTRPDGKTETAGMLVVDEPRAKQSDPTVLDLQLRTLTKQTTVKPVVRNPCMNICIIYMCSTMCAFYPYIY